MNKNSTSIIKNISYSFFANAVSMAVSVIMVVLLPKLLSITDYGYWQLYLFYTSYLGFFHFGWLDGIYLRYGGAYFEKLDKILFTGQLLGLFIFECVIAVVGSIAISFIIQDVNMVSVLQYTCLVLVPVIIYTFDSFILQITNLIKKYALLLLVERVVFIFVVVFFLLQGFINYKYIIIADIVAKVFVCLSSLYTVRKLFVFKINSIAKIVQEAIINISIGSKLLLANIAGLFTIGIIRFAIVNHWSVEIFGKVSLMFSISNFLMLFINSLSVVIFPLLKRMEVARQKAMYNKLRILLTVMLFGCLLVYYPIKYIISWWLPKYHDSLVYMVLLFPVFLFESRVVLLSNIYLKSMRLENAMLRCNFIIALFSCFIAIIGVYCFENIKMLVMGITLVFICKNFLSEYLLNSVIHIDLLHVYWLEELALVIAFVAVNYYVDQTVYGMASFIGFLSIYLIYNKENLLKAVKIARGV